LATEGPPLRGAREPVGRRGFLLCLPALAAASRLLAQTAPPIRVRTINHLALLSSDPEDALDFYQGLFGMPIQARHGPTALLRVGTGPQFLAIGPAGGEPPRISHFCVGVENFDADDLVSRLEDHGFTRATDSSDSLSGGPMKVRVQMRGPEWGGSPDGTPHVYLGDPDGIVMQLQHPSYCGGASVLGNLCNAPEPANHLGLISLSGLGPPAMSVSDATRSRTFYHSLLGLDVRAHQTASQTRGIDDVRLNVENLSVDRAREALTRFGVKPRDVGVSAAGVSFADPDGLVIQLQDARQGQPVD